MDATVKKISAQTDGTLRLALLDSNGEVISSRNFPLAGLKPDTVISLPVVNADWSETPRTNQLTLRLEVSSLTDSSTLGIASAKPREYRDGIFAVGGNKQDADLVFHYTCANPWTGN